MKTKIFIFILMTIIVILSIVTLSSSLCFKTIPEKHHVRWVYNYTTNYGADVYQQFDNRYILNERVFVGTPPPDYYYQSNRIINSCSTE